MYKPTLDWVLPKQKIIIPALKQNLLQQTNTYVCTEWERREADRQTQSLKSGREERERDRDNHLRVEEKRDRQTDRQRQSLKSGREERQTETVTSEWKRRDRQRQSLHSMYVHHFIQCMFTTSFNACSYWQATQHLQYVGQ